MKNQFILAFIFLAGISFKGFSQAAFTMDTAAGCLPVCVSFTDQTPNATSWLWDFGDASTSTIQNPMHCYNNAGAYTVTLTATTSSGTSTATATVTVYPNPVASFIFSVVGTNTISFSDQSTGAVSWDWWFGDASAVGVQQNPTHTYASTGTYTVGLVVTSSNGCTDSISQVITLVGISDLANTGANWSMYPNPSNGQISIHFEGIIQNAEMLRVENMLGQVVLEKEISSDTFIDLSTEASGIYFVRVGNSPAKKLMVR